MLLVRPTAASIKRRSRRRVKHHKYVHNRSIPSRCFVLVNCNPLPSIPYSTVSVFVKASKPQHNSKTKYLSNNRKRLKHLPKQSSSIVEIRNVNFVSFLVTYLEKDSRKSWKIGLWNMNIVKVTRFWQSTLIPSHFSSHLHNGWYIHPHLVPTPPPTPPRHPKKYKKARSFSSSYKIHCLLFCTFVHLMTSITALVVRRKKTKGTTNFVVCNLSNFLHPWRH